MKKIYYLAYGSNLNIRDMKNRCPSAEKVNSMILLDYRLVFKGLEEGFSYLTIEKSKNDRVPIGIFKLDSEEIKKLDMYEGYPDLYNKEYLKIKIEETYETALIYIMNNEYEYNMPSDMYLKKCKQGYEDFNFDKLIINKALNDTKNSIKTHKYLL